MINLVNQKINLVASFGKICIFFSSAGASFLWQFVVAFATSTSLSAIDAAAFLFYYNTLSAVSFWDLGFSLAQASSLNKYLRCQRNYEIHLDESIALAAQYYLKYFLLRISRGIAIASLFSAILICISFFRSNFLSSSQILSCILLAFSYLLKAPGDSMILLFEVRHNPQYGKVVQGISQVLGSIIIALLIYSHSITILSIALIFFLSNVLTTSLSYSLLQTQRKKGILSNAAAQQIRDHMKLIEVRLKVRANFFLPSIISYISSFLALPVSYLLVNPNQIPILNNLLFLNRGLSLPSSILISVYRAKYSSFLQTQQKVSFIKRLTLVSCFVTITSVSLFLIFVLLINSGFIKAPVLILPFTQIPLSWLFISLINICLVAIISPLLQSIYFSGSNLISRLMIGNIIIDLVLSTVLGIKYGIVGILIGTLMAGVLTLYSYGFNALYQIYFRNELPC